MNAYSNASFEIKLQALRLVMSGILDLVAVVVDQHGKGQSLTAMAMYETDGSLSKTSLIYMSHFDNYNYTKN